MKKFLALLVLYVSICAYGYSQPANDDCSGATPISIPSGGSACVTGSTVGATGTTWTTTVCGQTNWANDVWYTFVSTGTVNTVIVSPTGNPAAQMLGVSIYSGNCTNYISAPGSCAISATNGGTDTASYPAPVGTVFYVEVNSFGTAGDFQLCVNSTTPPPSPGNTCGTAARLCTFAPFTLATVPAGGSTFTPDCFGPNTPAAGQWYQFTVGVTGSLAWECTPTTPSSGFFGDGVELDWALYDITSGCPTNVNQSNEVGCNFNFEGENSDPIGMSASSTTVCPTSADPGTAAGEFCPSVTVTAGQTYAIFINNYTNNIATGWDFNFNGSTFQMAPVDTFVAAPDTICGNTGIVTLNNLSVAAVWQEWNFGDGDTSVDSIPLPHTYADTGTYFISLKDSSKTGCISVASKSVLITAYPTVTVNNDTTCSGSPATLTAVPSVPGGTYLWSPGGATTSSITVTVTVNTPYTVTYTSPTGCSASGTGTVVISNNAVATVTPSAVTICPGQSTMLTASTGTGYSWSTTATSQSVTVSPAATTTYDVTVTVTGTCIATASATVTVVAPTASITPSSANVCPGSNDTLTASAGVGYVWSGTAATTSSIIVSPTVPTTYDVTVTISGTCTASATTTIGINPVPPVQITPSTATICNGSSTPLLATGGIGYLWSTGVIGNSITVSPGVTTTYTVTGANAEACTASASAVVTVSPIFTVSPTITDVNCNGGTTGSIVLTVTGTTNPYAYTWNNGSTASSITNLAAGIDTVTVSDVNNCSVVQYDTVTQPTALILGLPNIINIGCAGGNTGSITANPSGGTPVYTYAWLEQSNNMTFTGQTISGLAADNYGLMVTDSKGCTAVAAYTITSIPVLAFTPSSTNITCAGYANGTALVTLTSGTPPFEYEWSGNGTPDDSTMTGIAPGGVSVVVTDANNCTGYAGFTITEPQQIYVADTNLGNNVSCFGGSNGRIVVYAYGGTGTLFPLWSNGPGGYTDSNLVAGIYTVTVTDSNLCTATLTDTVTQPAAIIPVLNSQEALCYGGADGYAWAVPSGGVSPYMYSWSNSDQTDTASGLSTNGSPYYCTVTDANQCTATATVSVGQPTELYINPTASAVKCAGQKNGTIAVADTGGIPPYNYSATTDGFNFIYATDSLIEGLDTGWYTVLVSDSNGCTKETQVYVPNAIPDQDSVTTDSTLCYGPDYNDGAIIVTESVGFNQPYEYSLDLGIYQDNGSFYGVSAGNHTVYVINGNQCEDTIPVVVYEPLPVVAEVIPDTVILEPGQNKQVQVSELNAPNPSYSWTPALGLSCIDCPNPVVNTYTAGMYTVTVSTVNDSAVCYGSATLWVELISQPQVFIPDAFSPNGDGNNDMFMIYGDNIKTLDLRVFNRWGELVFETENQYNGWDGTYKGHLQLPGVFVYEASITFLDNSQTQKSGTVTLVR